MPEFDLDGKKCTILLEAMGVILGPVLNASGRFLSVQRLDIPAQPELGRWEVQLFHASRGTALLRVVGSSDFAGVTIPVGSGRATMITTEVNRHMFLWEALFDQMGARAAVKHDLAMGGLLIDRMRNVQGERFVSVINLDQEEKTFKLSRLDLAMTIEGRKAKLLPIGVRFGKVTVLKATTEIVRRSEHSLTFRGTHVPEEIHLELEAGAAIKAKRVDRGGSRAVVRIAAGEKETTIVFG